MCEILLHVSRNLYQVHDLKKTTIYNSLYRYVFYDTFNLLSDLFVYMYNSQRSPITMDVWYLTLVNHVHFAVHDK